MKCQHLLLLAKSGGLLLINSPYCKLIYHLWLEVGGLGNMDYEGIVNTVFTSVIEFYVPLAPLMPLTAHGDYTKMIYLLIMWLATFLKK